MDTCRLLAAASAAALFAAAGLVAAGCGHSGGGASSASSAPDGGDAQTASTDAAAGGESDAAGGDAAAQGDGFSLEASADGALVCVLASGQACDQCTATNCCQQLLKCATELSDGGPTVCQSIQSCVLDCLNQGAITSTVAGCSLTCSQAYGTNPKVADWNDLLGCQQSSCFGTCY